VKSKKQHALARFQEALAMCWRVERAEPLKKRAGKPGKAASSEAG